MKRLMMAAVTAGFLVTAVALSGNPGKLPTLAREELQIQSEGRNPWTHLRINNDPEEFRFAIVSDRTGGHRAKVFSQAVEQLNLLQPEFVLSVGDLIEGYKEDPVKLDQEWREFQMYVSKLQMPFFYVPGNHDIANSFMGKLWKEKFGRLYYHFIYRDVMFLILNSNDPTGKESRISPEQVAYVKKTLAENCCVRWTIVALHKPLWAHTDVNKNGWLDVEQLLTDRPYTVFAGHVHKYEKWVRNGRNYYQLATTGGDSKMRGVRYGEFDHLVWITMKNSGPVMANIMMDGIYPESMQPIVTAEDGVGAGNRKSVHPVRGKIYFDGCPLANVMVDFNQYDAKNKKYSHVSDALVDPDGTFALSTYTAFDGAPVGEYFVTIRNAAAHGLPVRCAKPETSGLRAEVKAGVNQLVLELKK